MIHSIKYLLAAAGCLALLIGSPAVSGKGMQFDEFEASGELYVDCLGEMLAYEERIEVAYLSFETPSGNVHWIENWKFYLTATGMTTGRMWFGILPSPSQLHSGPVEVSQYAIRGVVRGISRATPGFAYTGSYKVTVNANGELAVENDTGGFEARCLGKK